jgi:hypothetical protein
VATLLGVVRLAIVGHRRVSQQDRQDLWHEAWTYLFPHFPHALQTMEHVAAPQQLAAKDNTYGVGKVSACSELRG